VSNKEDTNMVNKILCADCHEPAELVTEPHFSLVCFACGNESVLTYDAHWHEIDLDPDEFESDGFIHANPRRV